MVTCQQCLKSIEKPQGKVVNRLFYTVHEGAVIMQCAYCAQLYLSYFVEHRDDTLDYLCAVSAAEVANLSAADDQRKQVRSLIGSRRVHFTSPWCAEWTDGARVLMDPRPW